MALELVGRTEEMGPDVAFAAIQSQGDLTDVHLVLVAHGEDDLLAGRQMIDGVVDPGRRAAIDDDLLGGWSGRRRLVKKGFQRHQADARTALLAAQEIDGAIDADSVDPGLETRAQAGIIGIHGVESFDERVLGHVFRGWADRCSATGTRNLHAPRTGW